MISHQHSSLHLAAIMNHFYKKMSSWFLSRYREGKKKKKTVSELTESVVIPTTCNLLEAPCFLCFSILYIKHCYCYLAPKHLYCRKLQRENSKNVITIKHGFRNYSWNRFSDFTQVCFIPTELFKRWESMLGTSSLPLQFILLVVNIEVSVLEYKKRYIYQVSFLIFISLIFSNWRTDLLLGLHLFEEKHMHQKCLK